MTDQYRVSPNDALVAEFLKMRADIRSLQQAQTVIPILDADPSVNQPGNIWLFADGRLRMRLYDGTIKEFAAVAVPGAGTSGTPKPQRPTPGTTKSKQWSATWSQSYKDDGSQRADYPERLWIGNFPGILGNNAALIGFDWADIETILAGAVIAGIRVKYRNGQANTADGRIHIYWGTHYNDPAPTIFQNIISYPVANQWYGASESAWTQLPAWVGEELRDGASLGLLIAGGDGVGVNGWGYGATTGTPPILEITYVN